MNAEQIPKTLGRYAVYPSGTVYSFSGWRGYGARRMKYSTDEDGYDFVRLVLNGKREKWRIHRLIAEMFLPSRPSPAHEVRHLDGNKLNNRLENLAWGTAKENAADREKHGRTSRGETHSDAIKTGMARARDAGIHIGRPFRSVA